MNYDSISGGDAMEAIEWLAGYPCFSYSLLYPTEEVKDITTAWRFILDGLSKKSPMTLSTEKGSGYNKYGLVQGHSYPIVGLNILYDHGKASYFLLKVFNPWRNDKAYNGTFSD